MSSPSIVVTNCGRRSASPRTCASRSPSPNSARASASSRAARPASDPTTVSLSGHRVAAMRRFMSASASSEKWTWKGRMASAPPSLFACVTGVPVPAPSGACIIAIVTPMRNATRVQTSFMVIPPFRRMRFELSSLPVPWRRWIPEIGHRRAGADRLDRPTSCGERYRETGAQTCKKGVKS